jgi:hypothetical protein
MSGISLVHNPFHEEHGVTSQYPGSRYSQPTVQSLLPLCGNHWCSGVGADFLLPNRHSVFTSPDGISELRDRICYLLLTVSLPRRQLSCHLFRFVPFSLWGYLLAYFTWRHSGVRSQISVLCVVLATHRQKSKVLKLVHFGRVCVFGAMDCNRFS